MNNGFKDLFEAQTEFHWDGFLDCYDQYDNNADVVNGNIVIVFDNKMNLKGMFDIQDSKRFKKESDSLYWENLYDFDEAMSDLDFVNNKMDKTTANFFDKYANFDNIKLSSKNVTPKYLKKLCSDMKKFLKKNKGFPKYDDYYEDSKGQTYMKF